MAIKRQDVFRDTYTTRIACDTLTSLLLEALSEQGYECSGACSPSEEGPIGIRLRCRKMPPSDELEEALNYVEYVTGVEVDAREAEAGEDVHTVRELLERAAKNARALCMQRLAPLLAQKAEYALLVGWNGYAALIEGDERRVRFVGRYSATAHTHPGSVCLPSHYDLENAARLLSDGGCCTMILSPMCLFIARRIASLDIEDYDTLLEYARRLSKIRSIDDALNLVSEANAQLRNVRLEVYAL